MPFKLKESNHSQVTFSQVQCAKIGLIHSSEYCLMNAMNLAALSELAYKEIKEDIKKILEPLHLTKRTKLESEALNYNGPILHPYLGDKSHSTTTYQPIQATSSSLSFIDTQAFFYNDDEYNVLVFRGTAGSKDIATDIYAPREFFQVGKVHKGFLDNFFAVKDQISALLEKPENKKCKTIITGHSLGGALATLASGFITTNYFGDPCGQVMTYTYGSPRVGDKQWVDFYTHSKPFIHFRHRRAGDPITLLPPHHSDMRIPTLSQISADAAVGAQQGGISSGSAGVVFGAATIATSRMVLSILNSSHSNDAYVHHGQGILLQAIGSSGVELMSVNLPAESIALDSSGLNSKEVLLGRELWESFSCLVRNRFGPHSKAGYVGDLSALLKKAIAAWDKDPKAWLNRCRNASIYWGAQLEQAQSARLKAKLAFKTTAPASTTSVSTTPRIATPQEKEMAWDQIVSNAMATKLWANGQATFWAQPNAKELLFKLIFTGSFDNAFKKELNRQLKTGA